MAARAPTSPTETVEAAVGTAPLQRLPWRNSEPSGRAVGGTVDTYCDRCGGDGCGCVEGVGEWGLHDPVT